VSNWFKSFRKRLPFYSYLLDHQVSLTAPIPELLVMFNQARNATLRGLTVQVQLPESDGPIHQQADR